MYTVKQAAKILGMTEHTIRFYTDKGLVPSVYRDRNHNRQFDERSIKWLTGIKRLKECGMSIQDIKRYVELCLEGDGTVQERYHMMLEQRKKAYALLEEAKRLAAYMDHKVEHYHDISAGLREDDTNPALWPAEQEAMAKEA